MVVYQPFDNHVENLGDQDEGQAELSETTEQSISVSMAMMAVTFK